MSDKTAAAMSEGMRAYFSGMLSDVSAAYTLAQEARAKRLDPEDAVEIPLAEDVAARVEGLVATLLPGLLNSGLAGRIRELERQFGKSDERVALMASREVFEGKFCRFEGAEGAIEAGLRVGLAYVTLGIVTAPLEGLSALKVKSRKDGGKYVALYFSGPIRSAGGTANAFAVLIADYLRRLAGLGEYDPDENEVERYVVELDDYDTRVTNLQYRPHPDEIRFLAGKIPLEITGDPTEQLEVLSYKDLPRVETNRVRGGMCLTLSMVGLKAGKLLKRIRKFGADFDLGGWEWLSEYECLKKTLHSARSDGADVKGSDTARPPPNYTFLEEIPGGRPVFAYPSRPGGFRLRYGRARNTGFAAVGISPITMTILDDFIAVGTQLKLERPGKAGAVGSVDSIDGPVVLLKSGEVVKPKSVEEARRLRPDVAEILFIGDILISYGEFVANNHRIMPAAYCEEVWVQELAAKLSGNIPPSAISERRLREILSNPRNVSPSEAVELSTGFGVPMHPAFTYFYNNVCAEELLALRSLLLGSCRRDDGRIEMPYDAKVKRTLEKICVPHKPEGGLIVVEGAHPLFLSLCGKANAVHEGASSPPLELVNALSPVRIMDKAPTFIGSRMGRPEKAERRALDGKPQALFPVGQAGGRLRSVNAASETKFNSELAYRVCPSCANNKRSYFLKCPSCGAKTIQKRLCLKCGKVTDAKSHCGKGTKGHSLVDINLSEQLTSALSGLGERRMPELLKGVRGLSSELKIPERVEKGLLRAKWGLYVNKDGTIRFDCTNMPLTHFRPSEVGVPVERLRELGYAKDVKGEPLTRGDQLLELKPQDILMSDFSDPTGKIISGADYLVRVAKFIDDLLVKFYGLSPFYKVEKKSDLVGHQVVCLAPHTSAGVLGRIIGFTRARVGYAHPLMHAAKKRNADGDEDSIILLLDALVNFSRQFLPDQKGGRTMDCPLVLTTLLDPSEVDDEVQDVDTCWSYPVEFYEKSHEFPEPGSFKIERLRNRMGTPAQYEGWGFTSDTTDVQGGPLVTAYRSLGPMLEKVQVQLRLAEKITAVDEDDVAQLILSSHFLKDIKGNLRTYCRQEFRCTSCNGKFRRMPLMGKCGKCGGKLLMTVHRGTIEKYLGPSIRIAERYNVPAYMKQELLILQRRLTTMFGKGKQQNLDSFFK